MSCKHKQSKARRTEPSLHLAFFARRNWERREFESYKGWSFLFAVAWRGWWGGRRFGWMRRWWGSAWRWIDVFVAQNDVWEEDYGISCTNRFCLRWLLWFGSPRLVWKRFRLDVLWSLSIRCLLVWCPSGGWGLILFFSFFLPSCCFAWSFILHAQIYLLVLCGSCTLPKAPPIRE